MTVAELVAELKLNVLAGHSGLEQQVSGGYSGDLLSNAMGQAAANNIWVTMQGHQNIVAVAALAGLSAVLVAGAVQPDVQAIEKAKAQNVVLLTTPLPVFEVVGRLYTLGIRGV